MVDIVHTTNAYYVSEVPEVDAMKLSSSGPLGGKGKRRLGLFQRFAREKGSLSSGQNRHGCAFLPVSHATHKNGGSQRVQYPRLSHVPLRVIKGLGGNPVVIHLRTFTKPSKERWSMGIVLSLSASGSGDHQSKTEFLFSRDSIQGRILWS